MLEVLDPLSIEDIDAYAAEINEKEVEEWNGQVRELMALSRIKMIRNLTGAGVIDSQKIHRAMLNNHRNDQEAMYDLSEIVE